MKCTDNKRGNTQDKKVNSNEYTGNTRGNTHKYGNTLAVLSGNIRGNTKAINRRVIFKVISDILNNRVICM